MHLRHSSGNPALSRQDVTQNFCLRGNGKRRGNWSCAGGRHNAGPAQTYFRARRFPTLSWNASLFAGTFLVSSLVRQRSAGGRCRGSLSVRGYTRRERQAQGALSRATRSAPDPKRQRHAQGLLGDARPAPRDGAANYNSRQSVRLPGTIVGGPWWGCLVGWRW